MHITVLLLFVVTALAAQVLDYAAPGTFEAIPLEGARSLGALVANLFMLRGCRRANSAGTIPHGRSAWNSWPIWSSRRLWPWVWRSGAVAKVLLAVGAMTALGGLAWLTRDNFDQWDGPQTLLRCLPEFLPGTLLYSAYRRHS
ncbi:hypothetical protein F1643_11355 [Azospirillum sp. INR13]|uniref:hypothetical protein n=1 Tax=Azospirillum sp. INR13 TaxID=2596919 RepID=UPI0018924F7B|nr:hypothetical protein [Azospirillum sp. INR13]MBF5094995.1 hypothetical protein [Azospirillum sp. INR13]